MGRGKSSTFVMPNLLAPPPPALLTPNYSPAVGVGLAGRGING